MRQDAAWDDDDEDDRKGPKRLKEFDCPSCNASNPLGDPAEDGDEVLCNYCGSDFRVTFNSEGRARLKEL